MKYSIKGKSIFAKTCLIILLGMMAFLCIKSLSEINIFAAHYDVRVQHKALVMAFLTLVLGMAVYVVFKFINKCNETKLKYINYILVLLMLGMQAILILAIDVGQITDPFIVNDQALSIAKGIENTIDSDMGYFAAYGNNYFVVVATIYFYKILMFFGISDFNFYFELLNVFMIDLTVFLLYKSVKICFNKQKATKYLFISVFNPLNYVMIFWFYTATYSMPLTVGIIYLAISIWKDCDSHKKINYFKVAVIAIISVLGYFLRPTVLIPLIAVFICFLLVIRINKKLMIRAVTFAAIFLITGVLVYSTVHYQVYKYVEDDSGNFPLTHWVMLGLDKEGRATSEAQFYTASFEGKEAKTEANIKEIKNKLKKMGVGGFLEHLAEKLQVTWTDGTADYVSRARQGTNFGELHSWIFGERDSFFIVFCQMFRVLTLGLAAVCIFVQILNKKYDVRFLFSLTLLGVIVFYLIWEAKEAYSLPFIPVLLVLSSLGMDDVIEQIEKRKVCCNRKVVVAFIALMEVITLVIGIRYQVDFTESIFKWRDTTISSNNAVFAGFVGNDETEKVNIKQNFYASKEFNLIEIKCRAIEGEYTEYTLELRGGGKKLAEAKVNSYMIRNEKIIFNVGSQKPDGEEKYILKIKSNKKKDSIEWSVNGYKATNIYKGGLYVQGEKQKADLFMNVFRSYQAPYIGIIQYWILIILMMLLEAGCGYIIWEDAIEKRC